MGLERKLTSRKSFHDSLYHEIKNKLRASSKQDAIILKSMLKTMRTNKKKCKKADVPYARKPMFKLNSQAWKTVGEFAELTVAPNKTIKVRLASYVMKMVDGAHLGSVAVTPKNLILAYSKTVEDKIPDGYIGVDMNIDSVPSS